MSGPVISAGTDNLMARIGEGERSQSSGGQPLKLAHRSPTVGSGVVPGMQADPSRDSRGRAPLECASDAETELVSAQGGGGSGGGGGTPAVVGGGGGGGSSGGGGGKRRHRRRPSKKKRRWKPYFKLSWEEKKQLDERESVRAAKTRAEMFAKGFTVAPYNTTQFLMEEHNQEEPDLNTGVCPKRVNKSDETSEEEELDEEDQDSGSDGMGGNGSEFLQRDFSETYEKYHAESLQNMTKQELIREYLELEKCLSRLEDEKNRLRGRLECMKARSADAAEIQMKEIEHEVEMLKAENERLEKENEQYKQERYLEGGE